MLANTAVAVAAFGLFVALCVALFGGAEARLAADWSAATAHRQHFVEGHNNCSGWKADAAPPPLKHGVSSGNVDGNRSVWVSTTTAPKVGCETIATGGLAFVLVAVLLLVALQTLSTLPLHLVIMYVKGKLISEAEDMAVAEADARRGKGGGTA